MIPLGAETHVLVLTGAGISAESGVPTFRGSGGMWKDHPLTDVATPEGFERDPALVWRFYSERRAKGLGVAPNPGHRALVALEQQLGDRFLLATQNVDGLHALAGSQRVLELHGNLYLSRCADCERPPFGDRRLHTKALPRCDRCGGRIRPHIVWFGEALDPLILAKITAFLRAGRAELVFLAVGTSGAVYPAAGLVDAATSFGAQTWLVNAEPAQNRSRFAHFVQGQSGAVLPSLFGLDADLAGASGKSRLPP